MDHPPRRSTKTEKSRRKEAGPGTPEGRRQRWRQKRAAEKQAPARRGRRLAGRETDFAEGPLERRFWLRGFAEGRRRCLSIGRRAQAGRRRPARIRHLAHRTFFRESGHELEHHLRPRQTSGADRTQIRPGFARFIGRFLFSEQRSDAPGAACDAARLAHGHTPGGFV